MNKAIEELFSKLPEWFYIIASLIILIGLLIFIIYLWIGAKRILDSINKENRIINLQNQLNSLKKEKDRQTNIASQLITVIENTRSFITSLNTNKTKDEIKLGTSNFLIQRIIEALASDVKHTAGERHRCGLWLQDGEGNLFLAFGSAGFPESYIPKRKLDINTTIAGRSFRKKEVICIDDVTKDTDYSPSESSGSYSALICIPMDTWGVLTVDAKKPMYNNTVKIAELYAKIIESIMIEIVNESTKIEYLNTFDEIAISKEEMEADQNDSSLSSRNV